MIVINNFAFISQDVSISNYSRLLEVNLNIIIYPKARQKMVIFNERTDFFLSNKIRISNSNSILAQNMPPSFIKSSWVVLI